MFKKVVKICIFWKYHCKSLPYWLADDDDGDANVHDATADEHEPQIVD